MRNATRCITSIQVLTLMVMGACSDDVTSPDTRAKTMRSASPTPAAASPPVQVSGSGIIFTGTTIVHSEEPTPTGMIQRSSVSGQLSGDLSGSILFNPVSVFDFANGTLVNTGNQFFSGTVAGSDPVVLHDDSFRFDIDLSTMSTVGTAHFSRSGDEPHQGHWFECDLVIVGTGVTAEGDITSDYSGECVERGRPE